MESGVGELNIPRGMLLGSQASYQGKLALLVYRLAPKKTLRWLVLQLAPRNKPHVDVDFS